MGAPLGDVSNLRIDNDGIPIAFRQRLIVMLLRLGVTADLAMHSCMGRYYQDWDAFRVRNSGVGRYQCYFMVMLSRDRSFRIIQF